MNTRRWILRTALSCALSVAPGLIPSVARAQANPDSVKLRNDCRLAAQILEKGQPAPKYDWALAQMDRCDPGLRVDVVTSLVRAHAYAAGTREAIVAAFNTASRFWDQRILQTLLDIAGDPAARVDARIEALAALAVYLDPQGVPAEGFRAGLAEDGTPADVCSWRSFHAASSRPVEVEPTEGFREGLVSVLWRMTHEPAPDEVKGALICAALAGG